MSMQLSRSLMLPARFGVLTLFVATVVLCASVTAAEVPPAAKGFLQKHCVDCHDGAAAEAGLDLAALSSDFQASGDFEKWVRIHDRVRAGEMPPQDAAEVTPTEVTAFTREFGGWLKTAQVDLQQKLGRVRARRLTNLQLERTLQDLLGIDIPLAEKMPDEPRTHGYTTVASGQSMSHFQVDSNLAVVDAALDEAFRRATSKPDEWTRTLDAKTLSRRRPRSRCREPELIDGKAVTWSSGLVFYGRLPSTTAREDGWYRFDIAYSAVNCPSDRGVWCSVRSGPCVSSAPLRSWVGAFEATPDEKSITVEAWLPKGHMLEIRPGDVTLKQARFAGGQVGTGEGGPQKVPGVALSSVTMQRIHRSPANWQVRRILFGEVDPRGEVKNGDAVVARLLHRFATRAFRRPVAADDIKAYVELSQGILRDTGSLQDALTGGYRALLCSPRFLHFHEAPGPLDDHAIASRLSYFLTQSMPDDELQQLADAGRLRDPRVLEAQTERLLQGASGRRFVEDFAAQWLELDQIDFTEPDRKLFRSFDIVVQQSMLEETHSFLEKLLRDDLQVTQLIDSDFTFLNSRLARFYGIDRVEHEQVQQVKLLPEDHRGGVLTQGAILKVTANGTTTSPVIRGVWISERLLGEFIPPPPQNVPAIEPDIRGAKSIREMLEKHRSDAACMSCHRTIDPPGFALENFDPAGQWRNSYIAFNKGRRQKNGLKIDASATLPNGRQFDGIKGFQQAVTAEPDHLARNLAEQLLTFGTGAPVSFADREAVAAIVNDTKESGYGVRSIIKRVVTSPVFLTK